jgi:hypothetical protein
MLNERDFINKLRSTQLTSFSPTLLRYALAQPLSPSPFTLPYGARLFVPVTALTNESEEL